YSVDCHCTRLQSLTSGAFRSVFLLYSGSHRSLHSFPTTTLFRSPWPDAGLDLLEVVEHDARRADGKGCVTCADGLRKSDGEEILDRKSTRLNSSHLVISYAVFCLKKKKQIASNAMFAKADRT